MDQNNSQESGPTSEAPDYRTALLALGGVIGLALLWALIQPGLREGSAQNASGAMLDTLHQAETRLTAHFTEEDFSGLDSEILRQVAFQGQGQPVDPSQSLWVRGGSMGLGAAPIQNGRGFALIVDGAGRSECETIVAEYRDNPLLINSREVAIESASYCNHHDNMIRIDIIPETKAEQ